MNTDPHHYGRGVADGVTPDIGVMDGAFVGVVEGVDAVTFGVGVAFTAAVGCALTAAFGVTVGLGSGVAVTMGVGVIKMTRIAPSSGTGDTVFFPETRTPITITTRTMTPAIIVSAAMVFRRSSIY